MDQRCQFLNFGIGNEKSLLCTTIAIILKTVNPNTVIILNKNEYLNYRDYSKFKDCIEECNLLPSYLKFEPNSIVYADERSFKVLKKESQKDTNPHKSILIIDEYDQYFFDSKSSKSMLNSLMDVNLFSMIIGISGTT